MKLKDKFANDFADKLIYPNRKAAREAWLQGFQAAKHLILHELQTKAGMDFADIIADVGDDDNSTSRTPN